MSDSNIFAPKSLQPCPSELQNPDLTHQSNLELETADSSFHIAQPLIASANSKLQLIFSELREEHNLSQLKLLLETIDDAILLLDAQRHPIFANSAAEELLGAIIGDLTQQNWKENLEARDSTSHFSESVQPELLSMIEGDQAEPESEIFRIATEGEATLWLTIVERELFSAEGTLLGSLMVCRNLSEYKRVEEKLLHDAFHDRLTGLPNRNLLLKKLEKLLDCSGQSDKCKFAVLFLDLDRFKVINESLGPIAGDQLLVAVAERLQNCLRAEDTIVRLGGDEFAILLEQIQDSTYSQQVANRINQELVLPFDLQGHEVFADVSIGIATSVQGYEKPEEILRDADIAMHRAKALGKSCYQIFDKEMHTDAIKLLQLESDMRRAVEREEFQIYYQPIVSLENETIAGFEALARWRHTKKGFIPPGQFIPIAEETGLIIPLGLWVLRESCWQMKIWQVQFPEAQNWTISVNISGRQLTKPHFVSNIENILSDTQLSPKNLKLEITESILLNSKQGVTRILRRLQSLGIQLAMDDFGTGYSSMSYLLDFPFNTLKIDQSFIRSMETSRKRLGIVRSIIAMANNLEMSVVAEGIETMSHLAQLKVLKCGYGQGHLFAKALDPESIQGFILSDLASSNERISEQNENFFEEEISREKLFLQIEHLQQELNKVKQEKDDLEILLETATEHASLVESELEQEICDYRKNEEELQKENRKLENLSTLDGLTQLANRRRFDEYLDAQWKELSEQNQPLSLILLDVDYFKRYNDCYGHQAGDRCLVYVAQAIEQAIHFSEDLVARYGGEEFAVILPDTELDESMEIAENIRALIIAKQIPHETSSVESYVTVSLGVANLNPSRKKLPTELVELADRALYQAKSQGRNRCVAVYKKQ